jgi:N-acetylated-alpha-linked acidic dipeptidase
LASLADAAAQLRESAQRATPLLQALASSSVAGAQQQADLDLPAVEQAFLEPEGLPGRPWYKHSLWAPGSYAGYSAVMMPSLSEAIDHKDVAMIRRGAGEIATALSRATAKLNDVARAAQSVPTQHGAD